MRYCCLVLLSLLVLCACTAVDRALPVQDINMYRVGQTWFYRVQPGDTLYSIAWQTDQDYRKLVKLNHLKPPYQVYAGNSLRLTKPCAIKHYTNSSSDRVEKAVHRWDWPIRGEVVQAFSDTNKGIDIARNYRVPVVAVAPGRVVYAGNGIYGYSYLVIIEHDVHYLTAYGYNSAILVHEGQLVKAKQPIAKVGKAPSGKYVLHFEVRKNGKPVDPLRHLN
jgi:lipoprotein NlpD